MSASVVTTNSSTQDFNIRIEKLLGEQQSKSAPESQVQEATKNTKKSMAAALLELTTIAAQLAKVDMSIAEVHDGVPEDPEAKRWHDISIQALRTSRKMLSEKQFAHLNEISALAGNVETSAALKMTPEQKPEETVPEPEPEETVPEQKTKAKSTWGSWTSADVDACPEFVPPPPGLESSCLQAEEGIGSLRQDLEILRRTQPEKVLIVRKIKKLGFESPQMLKQHFGQYGLVKEILVAHSHVKPTPKRPNGRVRPAALGFVIMACPEGAKKALEAGVMQEVSGHPIELQSFESFDSHYAAEESAECEH